MKRNFSVLSIEDCREIAQHVKKSIIGYDEKKQHMNGIKNFSDSLLTCMKALDLLNKISMTSAEDTAE